MGHEDKAVKKIIEIMEGKREMTHARSGPLDLKMRCEDVKFVNDAEGKRKLEYNAAYARE